MDEIDWVDFRFESDQVSGEISSNDSWLLMKSRYESVYPSNDIYDCRECSYRTRIPEFGQAIEHNGRRTLRQFFQENGMPL